VAVDGAGARPVREVGPNAVLAQLTQLLAAGSGLPAGAVREAYWTSTFRFHRRLADTYRTGRVLLAGDAAHIHSPFGGQASTPASATRRTWPGNSPGLHRSRYPGLRDSYEAERRPVAQQVLASTSA